MGKFLCYQTGEKSQAVLFTFQAKASVLDDHEQGRQHHRESLSQRCYQYKDITHSRLLCLRITAKVACISVTFLLL